MTTSAPYAFDVGNGSSLEVSRTINCHPMQASLPAVVNSFEMKDIGYGFENEGHGPPSESFESVLMTGNLTADDISTVQKSTWQWNKLFLTSNNQSTDFVPSDIDCGFPSNQIPKAWWCKLRAVITWGIFVRRDVAAKRKARSLGLLLLRSCYKS